MLANYLILFFVVQSFQYQVRLTHVIYIFGLFNHFQGCQIGPQHGHPRSLEENLGIFLRTQGTSIRIPLKFDLLIDFSRSLYTVFLMHRRTDLWGPDGDFYTRRICLLSTNQNPPLALEFDPDRFLDERLHKYLTPNPFIFLPFNAGPRICLGQQVTIFTSFIVIYISSDHHFNFSLRIMKLHFSLFDSCKTFPQFLWPHMPSRPTRVLLPSGRLRIGLDEKGGKKSGRRRI